MFPGSDSGYLYAPRKNCKAFGPNYCQEHFQVPIVKPKAKRCLMQQNYLTRAELDDMYQDFPNNVESYIRMCKARGSQWFDVTCEVSVEPACWARAVMVLMDVMLCTLCL